jgi:hypothetical protein
MRSTPCSLANSLAKLAPPPLTDQAVHDGPWADPGRWAKLSTSLMLPTQCSPGPPRQHHADPAATHCPCRSRRLRPPFPFTTGSPALRVVVNISPDTVFAANSQASCRSRGPCHSRRTGGKSCRHLRWARLRARRELASQAASYRSGSHRPLMPLTTERSAKPCLQSAPRTCVSLCKSGSDHPPANRCASQSR